MSKNIELILKTNFVMFNPFENKFYCYPLFESNIITVILKSRSYEKLFDDKNNLINMIRTTKFYKYFDFTDDYEKKSSANQLLYAASLSHDITSLTTLGYKYFISNGFPYGCPSLVSINHFSLNYPCSLP